VIAALAGPTLVFLLALAAVRRQRRRPLALAAALAFALMICFEASLVNALSVFHAVARGPLLVSHGIVGVAAAAGLRRRRSSARPRILPSPRFARGLAPLALVALLAVPIVYSALWYVPNNWDSMTYHLARVAHWLQNGSVGLYATHVSRQVTYPPGAEYLLVVLQGIAGTDRLASLVQLAAWLVVALAAAPLARLFGTPRRIAPWAALLFAAAPMAVLQASSTQNDLVASAVAMAIVVACVPFLHRGGRWRALDVVVAAAVLSAGVLVKPTALVVTAPFILWASAGAARAIAFRGGARRAVCGLAPAALVVVLVLAPELARRVAMGDHGEFGPFLYAPLSGGAERLLNPVRAIARHVPLPAGWTDALAGSTTRGCTVPRSMCADVARRSNEDLAGNPVSALLVVALLATGVARWRRLPARARAVLLALPAAWVLFGLVFRDNIWISRLHLPLFALAPLAASAMSGVAWPGRLLRFAVPAVGLALFATGARAVVRNELRPVPNPVAASLGLLPGAYYAARPEEWLAHVAAMMAIAQSGCDRLGLFIGRDSYDYPITWRATQRGIAVRHVVGPDAWPCVVYSDRGAPPPSPGGPWRPSTASPRVFVRERVDVTAAQRQGATTASAGGAR